MKLTSWASGLEHMTFDLILCKLKKIAGKKLCRNLSDTCARLRGSTGKGDNQEDPLIVGHTIETLLSQGDILNLFGEQDIDQSIVSNLHPSCQT